jgi:hypothetical protein
MPNAISFEIRAVAVTVTAILLSSCAAVQSMREAGGGDGMMFPSIDGAETAPSMAQAPMAIEAVPAMPAVDPLAASGPGIETAGGSQRMPLGSLSAPAVAPRPAPSPAMSIAEASATSAMAAREAAEREFRPQPAVLNAPAAEAAMAARPAEDSRMREFVPASLQAPRTVRDAMPGVTLSAGDRNVIQRFDALRRLREADLITAEEFERRRATNVGGLLPYTKPLPGLGLERSVPSAEAIIARIAALGRSLEMRAITPRQHQIERSMILNALLPEAPEARALRRAPPADFLEAASMVGKLEMLRVQNLISDDEFDAESDAIEKFLNSGQLPADKAAAERRRPPPPPMAAVPTVTAPKAPTEPVISGPVVRKIDLGQQQGIFYRLMAGPFPDLATAELTCIEVKKAGQFCRATEENS